MRGQVIVSHSVLSRMTAEAARRFPKESGGVLLGYSDPDDKRISHIVDQLGPGPRSKHHTHRFEPDGEWQDEQIGLKYAKSGRTIAYLGDWHSHPRGSGKPSGLDQSTAKAIAHCKEARVGHPLMLIIFGKPGDWEIECHRYGWRRLRSIEVVVESE